MQNLPFVPPRQLGNLRLFCFSYAGGSEHVFRTWGKVFPPSVELCPILLPGHGVRMNEPLHKALEPLAESLTTALLPYLDKPFAFFGHSMGALLSYSVACKFRNRDAALPKHLFTSAYRAPHLFPRRKPMHELPDTEFIKALRDFGGTPMEVVQDAELMAMLVPILRADFSVCDTYQYEPAEPLPVPITAIGGLDDNNVHRSDLDAWAEHTTQSFTLHMLPGDHFYLRSQEFSLTQLMISKLTV